MAGDDDDKLLKALGRIAAEDARHAEKWERVVTGDATKDELARLEADGEAKELLAASRPLDEAARDRIAESLAAKMAPRRRAARAWGTTGVIAGGLALAAGLAFLVTRPSPNALPGYTIDPVGPSSMRAPAPSAGTCVLRADPDGTYELVVRPERELRGEVQAAVYAFDGRDSHNVAADVEIAPSGSIRITGRRATLIGAASLTVVIARPQGFARNGAYRALHGETSEEWQTVGCRVESGARPDPH